MIPAKPPPRPGARRRLHRGVPGAALLAAALLAAHGFAWYQTSQALAAGFADWVASRRAEGWGVEHAPPRRAGWPFAARLEVPGILLEGTGLDWPVGLTWAADRVSLSIAPPALRRLIIETSGPQRLALGAIAVPLRLERLQVAVPLGADPAASLLELRAEGVRGSLPAGAFAARRAALLLSGADPGTALRLTLAAEEVLLPQSPALPAVAAFGPHVERLAIEAATTLPWPPFGPPERRARLWREAGGRLELRRLALRWGPLAAEARMTLGLDPALQPTGQGSVRLVEAGAALAALAGAGLLPRGLAGAAQGALALFQRRATEDGRPEVELPATIENGTLALARLPLLRLAPVIWAPAPAPPPGARHR